MIDLHKLKEFLKNADKPHANGTAEIKTEMDGSRSIKFGESDWSMHDNFYGGEPYGGRQVVFYNNEPVWLCVYYGKVINTEPAPEIYDFLREALRHAGKDELYRGPKVYKKDDYEYKNRVTGDIKDFTCTEQIVRSGKKVYEATFIGGIVDQRAKGSL